MEPSVSPLSNIPKEPINTNKIFYILIALIVLVSLGYLIIFGKNNIPFISSQKPSPSSEDSLITEDGMAKLPVPIEDPHVFRAAISYSFVGTIGNIRQQGNKREIILKDAIHLPIFVAEKDRTVFYWWDNTKKLSTYAKSDNVKIGDTVRINAFYSLKQNRWTTHQVFIYTSALPTHTPPTKITE